MGMLPTIKWLIGFLLAFLIIWPSSWLYVDSIPIYIKADASDFFHRMPDSIVRQCREGFAYTHIGRYGIIGIENANNIRASKVLIWGDSFVEAFNVADDKKMSHVLSNMSSQMFSKSITGVSIGRSGNSLADYYFQIPYYESRLQPVAAHIFIIGHIEDTLPDQKSAHGAKFVSSPAFKFYPEDHKRYKYDFYRKWLSHYKLDFLWYMVRDLQGKQWKWLPSTVSTNQTSLSSSAEKENKQGDFIEAWSYLLIQLKKQTNKPIVMVLLSEVPYLRNHQIILSEGERGISEQFKAVCHEHDIGFIDMKPSFIAYYESTGRFPRGFPNSHPWEGHLNENGHALVAADILKYLKENKIAIQ